jgi:hypothetical protein
MPTQIFDPAVSQIIVNAQTAAQQKRTKTVNVGPPRSST